MWVSWEDIIIKNNVILYGGNIELVEGINVIKAKNGIGKTLLVEEIAKKYNVVIMSQSNNIITSLSVEDNIILGKGDKKKLDELMEKYKLDYLLRRKARTLSGGEKRLVAILRVICSNASFVIMDEPTNDLDFEKISLLIDLLKEKKSFLIVTHDDRLIKIADKVITIDNKHVISSIEEKTIEMDNYSLESFHTKSFSHKFWGLFKVLKIIYALCIISCFCFTAYKMSSNEYMKYDEMDKRETFAFISQYSIEGEEYITSGAQYINLMKKVQPYDEDKVKLVKGIHYKGEHYYPIEVYNIKTRQYYGTIDEYKERYESEDVYIDTSDYFFYEDNIEEYKSIKKIDIDKYNEVVKSLLKNKDNVVTFANIKEDKIDLNDIDGDLEGIFVMNNETIHFTNSMNALRFYRKTIEFSFILLGVITIIDILINIGYWILLKKDIRVLIDNQYDKNSVEKSINNRKKNNIYIFLIMAPCLLMTRYFLGEETENMYISVLLIICFFMIIGSGKVKEYIVKSKFKSIYKRN